MAETLVFAAAVLLCLFDVLLMFWVVFDAWLWSEWFTFGFVGLMALFLLWVWGFHLVPELVDMLQGPRWNVAP